MRFFRPKRKFSRKSKISKKHNFSDEFKKQRTRKFLFARVSFFFTKISRKIWAFSAFIFFALVFATFVFFSEFFKIREIEIVRRDFHADLAAISKTLQPFRGENIFLVSKKTIAATLRKNFPQIETVEISKKFPRLVRIAVQNFPVVAKLQTTILQKNEMDIESDGVSKIDKFFFVNKIGQIAPAPPDTENLFLIVEKNQRRDFFEINAHAFDREIFNEIFATRAKIENDLKWKIARAEFFRAGREVHFICENGTAFWLDFAAPHDTQLSKLKYLNATKILEKKVEYFDLRIAGKIIWRER